MRMDDGDTRLETFLKALSEGGTTHVTQYGLKQAGFNALALTDYINARARAQAAPTEE